MPNIIAEEANLQPERTFQKLIKYLQCA